MSTLKTNNIEHLDASTPAIQVAVGGGVNITGVTTVGDNLTIDGVNRNITTGVGQTVGFGTDISIGGNLKSNGNSFVFPSSGGTLDRLERAGNILQVVSTTKTDTSTFVTASGGPTAAVPGLDVDITPTATSSKILVRGVISFSTNNVSSNGIGLFMLRDSTEISIGSAGNSNTRVTVAGYGNPDDNRLTQTIPFEFLDSPSTTSQITYGVKLFQPYSAPVTIYVNDNGDGLASGTRVRSTSVITAMEVAQ